MNKWIPAWALAIAQISTSVAFAQAVITPQEKAEARAERKIEGAAAARGVQPGEGDPKPAPHAKTSASERAAGRADRKTAGGEAARGPQMAEGDPIPEPGVKLTTQERKAGRSERRAEVRRENKAGEIPVYGEGYGGKQQ